MALKLLELNGHCTEKIAAGIAERKFNIRLFTVMIAHCIGYFVQGDILFFHRLDVTVLNGEICSLIKDFL